MNLNQYSLVSVCRKLYFMRRINSIEICSKNFLFNCKLLLITQVFHIILWQQSIFEIIGQISRIIFENPTF